MIVDPDEDTREDLLPEPPGEVLFDDELEPNTEPGLTDRLLGCLHGPLIAAVTFVPTFVTVVLGVPYLLGGTTPADAPGGPGRSVPALGTDLGNPGAPSDTIRDPFAPPAPPALPDTGRDVAREISRLGEPWKGPDRPHDDAPGPVAEPGADRAAPPAAPPAPAIEMAPRSAKERGGVGDWSRAAAFADRGAADRLADTIRQQGYPVDIREDRSAARPWVVWIGARPRSGAERRP
ncbi:MAG TPA: hypothetical protein VLK28_10690 [Methylomirabilota bacterium]|nr:hypothetical protein [Methylomirabilota bacterium]